MTEKKKLCDSDSGVVIVEASFVFPIMIIILFFLIYIGNAFFAKANVEAIVARNAVIGAGYCADPLQQSLKENGSLPSYSDLDLDPYRYILGGAKSVEGTIEKKIKSEIGNTSSNSFFKNMRPKIRSLEVKFNNYVIYTTFTVDLSYEIKFPIRFLGSDEITVLKLTSYAIVPVNDTTEFIRNTDMVIDYFGGNPMVQKIASYFGKINDLLSNFASK